MSDKETYNSTDEGQYSTGLYKQHQSGHGGGGGTIENSDSYIHGSGMYEFGNSHGNDAFSGYNTGSDTDDGPDPCLLLSILESAVRQQHDETTKAASTKTSSSIPEDIQRNHREHLEQTWKAIRTQWLWAHETLEERSIGARCRGEEDLAPLHLICKLASNPPSDIFNEILRVAPEVTGYVDTHGWLPLHHACIHGASTEVLKLLTQVHPDSTSALDAHHRTPLHLYATRGTSDHYNPATLAANFNILCSAHVDGDKNMNILMSPAEVRDKSGMVPMHYCCAYGTTKSVLRVMEAAFPESLESTDDHGRTPLHFVMVNSQRDASPGVLGYLLGNRDDGDDTNPEESRSIVNVTPRARHTASVNVRDNEGNLPLHLLNLGLVGIDFDQDPDKLWNVSECLKLYLEARPHVSTDFLAALQALPDALQDVAVVSPHVRNILNAKIIQRFPTSILMLDGIMLVTMIVCFELASTNFIDQIVASGPLDSNLLSSPLMMLYVTAAYFFLRELIQVIASLSLGTFYSWLCDASNWLDVLVITLVSYYNTIMVLGYSEALLAPTGVLTMEEDNDLESFRTGTALTKGVLWTAVIFFLKSTQVDFAVFLNGVFYVVQRLVAFLLAILVILISFAQMFWLVYLEQPVCTFSCGEGDKECEAEMEGCNYPHCEFGDSFLKVYTMMMGEIGTETRYDQNLVAQILYILYGFFIVILLSNVLIAIVTDSYEIVQNDRAAIVFWSNRLDFVTEMDSITSVVRKRILCKEGSSSKAKTSITPNATQDDRSYESGSSSSTGDIELDDTQEWFREKWNSIMSTFEHDAYCTADEDIRPIDFWYDGLNKTLAVLVIPPWLVLGFVTVGILWPPQVREWLFVQKDTVASRAEIERRKIEQLQDIQRDTKLLKDEVRAEMQHDREEMFRMKAEVDAVQEEVLSDLQQVNVLVTTLLTDLGGVPL